MFICTAYSTKGILENLLDASCLGTWRIEYNLGRNSFVTGFFRQRGVFLCRYQIRGSEIQQRRWFSGKIHACHRQANMRGPRVRFPADAFIFSFLVFFQELFFCLLDVGGVARTMR